MAISRGGRPLLRRVVLFVGAVALLGLLGFVSWASIPTPAEAGPLANVRNDPGVLFTETADAVVLRPASGSTGTGLVYLAGAHIDPAAYASKLAGIARGGVTVVIARPILNFAIFETRPLTTFTGLAPGVSTWYVGGHSLGGVRACQYAHDGAVAGLILFGSYCAADLRTSSLPVLSIAGSRDGLSTPAKIRANAHLLPADALFLTIDGADHGDFGDYGPQAGDNTSTTTDSAVRAQLTSDVLAFVR